MAQRSVATLCQRIGMPLTEQELAKSLYILPDKLTEFVVNNARDMKVVAKTLELQHKIKEIIKTTPGSHEAVFGGRTGEILEKIYELPVIEELRNLGVDTEKTMQWLRTTKGDKGGTWTIEEYVAKETGEPLEKLRSSSISSVNSDDEIRDIQPSIGSDGPDMGKKDGRNSPSGVEEVADCQDKKNTAIINASRLRGQFYCRESQQGPVQVSAGTPAKVSAGTQVAGPRDAPPKSKISR